MNAVVVRVGVRFAPLKGVLKRMISIFGLGNMVKYFFFNSIVSELCTRKEPFNRVLLSVNVPMVLDQE
ncbi:hypothetical protein SPONL_998 [uncultured Candidatus Thioglobus sp.]|nr:hypothetical protein SPONL_998 [uncultured Candidatus Thioglobus sp.]